MSAKRPDRAPRRAARRAILLAAGLSLWVFAPRAAFAERSALTSGVGAIAIVNASVVPMTDSRVLAGWTLLVRGGRIEDMGPARSYKVPRGASVMDGAGLWIAPGLYDCAADVGASDLPRLLASGVTTVRTASARGAATLVLRDAIADGRLAGPRLFVAGPPVAGGGAADLSPLEARREVEAVKRAGFDALALFPEAEALTAAAALRAAQELGLAVAGPLPARLSLAEALASGQGAREGLAPELDATTGAPRLVAGELQAAARAEAASGIWTIPMLAAQRRRASGEGAEALRARPGMESVPPRRRAEWTAALARLSDTSRADAAFEHVRRLAAAGAGLLPGSGAGAPFLVPGPSLHEELRSLVEAGLTPAQALRAATRDAAEALGELPTSGTIEPGKRADLLVLRANPLDDIGALAEPAGVFLAGRWLPASRLRAAVDSVAASLAAPAKRFASLEPLTVSDGYRYARYEISLAGTVVAEERLRAGPAAEGGRELRAQSAVDPDGGALAELRVVTSDDGRARSLRVTRTGDGARDRADVTRVPDRASGALDPWGAAHLRVTGERALSGAFDGDAECADGTVLAGPALAAGFGAPPVANAQLVLDRVDALPVGASVLVPVVRLTFDDTLSGGTRALRDATCRVTRLADATIDTFDGPRSGRRFRVEQPGMSGGAPVAIDATLGPDGLVHSLRDDAGGWSAARVR